MIIQRILETKMQLLYNIICIRLGYTKYNVYGKGLTEVDKKYTHSISGMGDGSYRVVRK